MTPVSSFCQFESPECSNNQDLFSSANTPLSRAGIAVSRSTSEMDMHSEPRYAVLQDPFAYYKAFLDTSVPPAARTNGLAHDDNGYICHTETIGLQESQTPGNQQQTRARAVPHNLAVRFANRSNGAPLATIVEQGSFSTLNSYGSLLSVGRFPPLVATENASPNRTTSRLSRSLDEKILRNIQEDAFLEQDGTVMVEAPAMPSANQGNERLHLVCDTYTPARSDFPESRHNPEPQIDDQDYVVDDRGVRGFLRGVLHNVRAASRTRSRSSSFTHVTIIDSQEEPADTINDSPQIHHQGRSFETPEMSNQKPDTYHHAESASSGVAFEVVPEPQPRNRKISRANSQSSAHVPPPLLRVPQSSYQTEPDHGPVIRLPACSLATHSRERCLLEHNVLPGPRNATHDDGTMEAAKPSIQDRHDIAAKYTFDDTSVPRNKTTSLAEVDCARYTSRNASFCSTMSTSYSGTVLGIDLDLQYGLSHQPRRSRPATPVWFTPQMAELERQASPSESTEWRQPTAAEPTSHTMTSSALMTLLPVAMASGIVRRNYDTPKISFYSPSGNLIQPEGSPTPGASISDYGGSPTNTISRYNKTNLPSDYITTSGLPPPRPSLQPMTTPPTSKSPLPSHLRHHHNYRQPELSHISSCEPFLIPIPAVKGCGGVVRNNSFSPRSGILQTHNGPSDAHLRHHRSTRSMVRSIRSEAEFYRLRFVNQVLSASCTPPLPPRPKGKTLQKRGIANQGLHTGKPHTRVAATSGISDHIDRHIWEGVCGPSSAAHALRICFCQPYDGAGKRGLCRGDHGDMDTGVNATDRHMEPNVRIARKGRRKGLRARSDSAVSGVVGLIDG
ncbi:hypothetical protein P153DRAFT_384773 [Dothidotthia symphoricarpi CBS 119687]|uniref:Uncharacterized protein n=1 Tax=Dothidotthia symphoricarpi CBS 119687 TaxID=1392245 RepID=A0A6A6AG10_9PLEO|nr:uncharacterized protein P153DRAFT_384773 [Dothidotthia symphoricarpi CBS 119687]KAF2130506.1 hypothetical protein P153DRAFT_384773 [Dothidotthia symphoricarpi CBS 119687]